MAASDKVAWDVAPPISGSGTEGLTGVFRQATSGTSARYKIPAGWRGRFIDVKAISQDLEILFGGSSVSVTYGQASSVTSEEITFNAATGFPVSSGTKEPYRVPDNDAVTHFAVAAAGAGGIAIFPSTNHLRDGYAAAPAV